VHFEMDPCTVVVDSLSELAPCGWRCPHRRPTVMGSIGNLVSATPYKQLVLYEREYFISDVFIDLYLIQ
jgi:hypothetical protein